MKKIVFLLLLSLPLIGWAQDKQHRLGVGLGYSINSVMNDSIRPFEVSLRYKIAKKHEVQLYAPFFKQEQPFKSGRAAIHGVSTILNIKKNVIGLGVVYDYTIYSYSIFDFLIGAKAEYLSSEHKTHITNPHIAVDANGIAYNAYDSAINTKKGQQINVGPSVGVRIGGNNLFLDAKFVLLATFIKANNSDHLKTVKFYDEILYEFEIIDPTQKYSKIRPAATVSISYYF